MSVGLGVGDILALTKIVVTAIKNIHDAPEELQELAERVKSVELNLQSINQLPADSVVENKRTIERFVKRIEDILGEIKSVVNKYKKTSPWKNALNWTKYGIWEKGEVGDLVKKLEQRTRDLTDCCVIQILLATNQIHKIFMSTHQEDGDLKKGSPTPAPSSAAPPDANGVSMDTSVISHRTDLVQSALERVVQSEQPCGSSLPSGQDDVSVQKDIQIELEKAGIEDRFTRALIEVINKQRKRLAHPEDIDPISYLGGKNRLEFPKGWIMVVDSLNEVRSIIAQTYLELVRVWTVNNNGQWLFNRVESAGVQIETKFAKRAWKSHSKPLLKGGNPPDKAALEAIYGKESFFQSEEKKEIFARIAKHKSRGIDNWHFRKYEYMLCFDKSIYKTLTMFAEYCKKRYGDLPSYENLSKIVLVADVKLKTSAANLSASDKDKLVDNVKNGVKSFLNITYGWQRPPLSIAGGPFRTQQIVLPTNTIKLSPEEREIKLGEIALKTECRIRVTDEKFDGHLFSITGRKEALPFAAVLLWESLV